MIAQNIPLYNFNNGTLMIIIFALVCVALVVAVFLFMSGGKKSTIEESNTVVEEIKNVEEVKSIEENEEPSL